MYCFLSAPRPALAAAQLPPGVAHCAAARALGQPSESGTFKCFIIFRTRQRKQNPHKLQIIEYVNNILTRSCLARFHCGPVKYFIAAPPVMLIKFTIGSPALFLPSLFLPHFFFVVVLNQASSFPKYNT